MTGHSSQITDNTEQLLGEILTELAERLSQGHPIDLTSYEAEYPQHAEKIRELLPTVESIVQLGLSGDASTGLHTGGQGINGKTGDVNEPLGDFRLLGEIGRGGMGVVYEAEQISIGRSVALKVLPFAAVLDHKAITRFKNEARAAGSLTHPNIVPVFGVGNERGVYYYAMALVHGLTLAEVIQDLKTHVLSSKGHDTQRFSLVEIVEQHSSGGDGPSVNSSQFDPTIDTGEMQESAQVDEPTVKEFHAAISTHRSKFGRDYQKQITRIGVQAADALHYAHENGIVHRDIKPGNLMIDTDGKLWITDFGLARIESDIGMTRSGDLLGTLRYMAPEQALGKRIIVDHRADIYSLGTTLYEMLALRSVFDGADRETLLKQLTFEEPRLLRNYCPTVSSDLETIVMKAIAKNPDERYASAGDMAEDLRALESNRPIKAKPATLWVRGKKWVGRNQGLVTATVVILAVATIGLGISNLLITQQRDAAQQAKEEESVQRAEAERQRQIAQENFERARDAVDEYLTRVSEEELLDVPGMQPLRRDLLNLAQKYYEEFVRERSDSPALRAELAIAYVRVGRIKAMIGAPNEAITDFESATKLQEKLVLERPDVAKYRSDLANSYRYTGAAKMLLFKPEEAVQLFHSAIEIYEWLDDRYDSTPENRTELADTLSRIAAAVTKTSTIGKYEQAQDYLNRSINIEKELIRDQPLNHKYHDSLAATLNDLATIQDKVGATDRAIESYKEAIEIERMLLELRADDPAHRRILSTSLYNLAGILQRNREQDAAIAQLSEAVELQEKLVAENPAVPRYRYLLATSMSGLGRSLTAMDRTEEARRILDRAVDLEEKLVAENPDVPEYRSMLVNLRIRLAGVLRKEGDYDSAKVIMGDAVGILNNRLNGKTSELFFIDGPPNPRNMIRGLEWAEAKDLLRGAIGEMEVLVIENPTTTKYRRDLATFMFNASREYRRNGEIDQYIELNQRAAAVWKKLLENPKNRLVKTDLISRLFEFGDMLERIGRSDEASAALQKIIDLVQATPELQRGYRLWEYLGRAHCSIQNWEEARLACEEGIKLQVRFPHVNFAPTRLYLSIALAHLDEKEKALENYDVLVKEFETYTPKYVHHRDDLAELAKLLGIEPEPDQAPENDESGDDATDGTPDADKNDPEVK